jgi:hypothetical protein
MAWGGTGDAVGTGVGVQVDSPVGVTAGVGESVAWRVAVDVGVSVGSGGSVAVGSAVEAVGLAGARVGVSVGGAGVGVSGACTTGVGVLSPVGDPQANSSDARPANAIDSSDFLIFMIGPRGKPSRSSPVADDPPSDPCFLQPGSII